MNGQETSRALCRGTWKVKRGFFFYFLVLFKKEMISFDRSRDGASGEGDVVEKEGDQWHWARRGLEQS